MGFFDVEFTTDEQTLADDAVANLQTTWPTWEPNDGDLEVVLIESVAAMAADVASIAASVPSGVFKEYGQTLVGVEYQPGVSATTTVTFNLVASLGYVIPLGTEIDIDGYAFSVDEDTIVDPGDSAIAGVAVSAVVEGVEANGLGDSSAMISALAFVQTVTVDDPTSGGIAEETDAEYLNRLTLALRLRAQSLVTTRDYELMALQAPAVGRASASTTNEREVTVAVTDAEGGTLSAPEKTSLEATFSVYKLVNTIVNVVDPSYVSVPLSYVVKPYSGFDATDLQARIDGVLAEYLSPATWGSPRTISDVDSSIWNAEPIVRVNKLIDMIGSVNGVDYVDSVSLAAAATTNLATNPSFETNTTGWSQNAATGSLTRDTTTNGAHSGVASGKQSNPGTNTNEGIKVTTDVDVTEDLTYTAGVWLKGSGASEAVSVVLGEYTTGGTLIGSTTESVILTTEWQRVLVTRAFSHTGKHARTTIRGTYTTAIDFYIDDVSLVESGHSVLNADLDLEMPEATTLPEIGTITGTVLS
ncbi:Carbohydrate-binding, CenC-like [uncultured Caudovirales phage]|uniref:Carbohydrate-binding, CenC-like n=1 Tax=uncultured Caudovirales phage TaxID=2100421 RepID=A0A6J5RNH4_9CAUD|nr:Carbohydrate-binding, CenC-like [uncultured Caudovirales phage]